MFLNIKTQIGSFSLLVLDVLISVWNFNCFASKEFFQPCNWKASVWFGLLTQMVQTENI